MWSPDFPGFLFDKKKWSQLSDILVQARETIQPHKTQSQGTNKKHLKPKFYWKHRFWSQLTENLLTSEEQSTLLEELTKEDREDTEEKSKTEQSLSKIVRKLIGALKHDKNKMWKVLKEMKGHRKEQLPRMMVNGKGEKVTAKWHYQELFHQALGRQDQGIQPKSLQQKKWKAEVEKAVSQWLQDSSKGWGAVEPSKTEIKNALQEARKDSCPWRRQSDY